VKRRAASGCVPGPRLKDSYPRIGELKLSNTTVLFEIMNTDFTRHDLKDWQRVGLRHGVKTLVVAATPLLVAIPIAFFLDSQHLLDQFPVRIAVSVAALGCLIWFGIACWRATPLLEKHTDTAFTCPACSKKLIGLHLDWAIWFGKCKQTRKTIFEETEQKHEPYR